MNGNRGAKGSVNDRIISYLFRKRYLEYLKKRENYTAEERKKAIDYLKKIKYFDIDDDVSMLDDSDKRLIENEIKDFNIKNIDPKLKKNVTSISNIDDSLNAIDDQSFTSNEEFERIDEDIIEFDPANELFDFDKYDYYEVINDKTGLAKVRDDEFIDVDKEIEKRKDEKIIIEELNEFVDDSLLVLDDIKSDLEFIKSEINKQYTQEELKQLQIKFDKLKEKIKKLKEQYDIVKEKYDFEDFELLESLTLIDSVEDFKSKANLEEIELMVDVCKEEIEAIDGVVIEDEKSIGVSDELFEKKFELIRRDDNYNNVKEETDLLFENKEFINKKTNKELEKIEQLEKNISKIETEVVRTKEYVYNTGRILGSMLRIIGGILTRPLTNSTILGMSFGNHLINRGLRELRSSLIPDEVERIEFIDRYKDVEKEIYNAKDSVKSTMYLIDDSLEHIEILKENYQSNLKKYALYIPEYSKLENMLNELEKKLLTNKELVKNMDKKLDNQYEKNKQRVYRANNPRKNR